MLPGNKKCAVTSNYSMTSWRTPSDIYKIDGRWEFAAAMIDARSMHCPRFRARGLIICYNYCQRAASRRCEAAGRQPNRAVRNIISVFHDISKQIQQRLRIDKIFACWHLAIAITSNNCYSGALARTKRALAEHHGWENLVNYPSEKIWLWRSVRPPVHTLHVSWCQMSHLGEINTLQAIRMRMNWQLSKSDIRWQQSHDHLAGSDERWVVFPTY